MAPHSAKSRIVSQTGKIILYATILEQRTRYKVEPLLSDVQMGFRKRRGCTARRHLCSTTTKREGNRVQPRIFVDQEKAFDRVNRYKLWRVLETYNVKGQLLDNIRAIYANSLSSVCTPNGLTDWFQLTPGVRQECVLSPLVFNVYMDNITKEANPEPEALNEMLFADDQSLANEDEKKLQKHTIK